ncbi:unnamed protein product [Linum trigynum]|uniref:Bifunctional inhibitor/plant lipid transfer protein/seed storage helical domain-containing protein n=1 Tax=Linum trigynum TaxID=586398 RepID=A0AAV2DY54_9ROSI
MVGIAAKIVSMLLVVAPYMASVDTIACGQVANSLAPCVNYMKNGGAVPAGCCNGVKALNGAAKTKVAAAY